MDVDILVTGASGALGRAIVSALRAQNKTVCAVGHFRSEFCDAVWDLAQDNAPSCDCVPRVVIHAAARTGHLQQPLSEAPALFDTNVTGSLRVAQWCLENQVEHVIYISGAIVYGVWQTQPKNENDAVAPWTAGPYAASKYYGEQVLLPLQQTNCALTVLRLSSLYGPGYTRGLIPHLMRTARTGGEIKLSPPRDDAFDLLYVSDAARTICNVVNERAVGMWNVGGGTLTPLDVLAQTCAQTVNARVIWQSEVETRGARILNWLDDRAARRELAHQNRVSLSSGLYEIAAQLP